MYVIQSTVFAYNKEAMGKFAGLLNTKFNSINYCSEFLTTQWTYLQFTNILVSQPSFHSYNIIQSLRDPQSPLKISSDWFV